MNKNNDTESRSFHISKKHSFCFKETVESLYGCQVSECKLKDIYNPQKSNPKGVVRGKGSTNTKGIGVYALAYKGQLMKIGQAADNKDGIFHRMSQYYRGKDGRCVHINLDNRDEVAVLYFNIEKTVECWAAEKLLQGIAFYMGEEMPWEEKVRHRGEKL